MAAPEGDVLQMVRSVINGTDYDNLNTGSWFGYVLADLQLAVGDGAIVHVDWKAEGDTSEEFEALVVVVTEEAVISAHYEQGDGGVDRAHSAVVMRRRDLVSVGLAASLPYSDHDTPGTVSARLAWSETSTLLLPLSTKSTSINKSLKTLIPSLLKDVTA